MCDRPCVAEVRALPITRVACKKRMEERHLQGLPEIGSHELYEGSVTDCLTCPTMFCNVASSSKRANVVQLELRFRYLYTCNIIHPDHNRINRYAVFQIVFATTDSSPWGVLAPDSPVGQRLHSTPSWTQLRNCHNVKNHGSLCKYSPLTITRFFPVQHKDVNVTRLDTKHNMVCAAWQEK